MAAIEDVLSDAWLGDLNRAWRETAPLVRHQNAGDELSIRFVVTGPGGQRTAVLTVGPNGRSFRAGRGFRPDAIVETDAATLQEVFTSDHPNALTNALAAGKLRVRGNMRRLHDNLGAVLSIADPQIGARMSRAAG